MGFAELTHPVVDFHFSMHSGLKACHGVGKPQFEACRAEVIQIDPLAGGSDFFAAAD